MSASELPSVSVSTDLADASANGVIAAELAGFFASSRALVIRHAFAPPDVLPAQADELGWPDPPHAAAGAIRAAASMLGTRLVAYPAYGGAEPFHRIGRGGLTGKLAALADRDLGPHTDLPNCTLPGEERAGDRAQAPHLVFLACLAGDGRTATAACHLEDALRPLPADVVQALREPAFAVRVPSAWKGEDVIDGVPCVVDDHGRLAVRLSPNLMTGASAAHSAALAALLLAAQSRMRSSILQAGDLLVLDNVQQVHGRASTTGDPTGPRMLVRAYAVADERLAAGQVGGVAEP
jgi:hypothetical protein